MNDLLSKFLDILNEKRLYPITKKFFSILFTFNISSYLYKKFWGTYDWLAYDDYNAILSFLIEGKYLVPVLLVILVYVGFELIVRGFFVFINSRRGNGKVSALKKRKFDYGEFIEDLERIIALVRRFTGYELTKQETMSFYSQYKNELTPEFYIILSRDLNKVKKEFRDYFILGVQMIILCALHISGAFTFLMFCLIIIFFALCAIVQFYLVFSTLPALVKRLDSELAIYLIEKQNQLS